MQQKQNQASIATSSVEEGLDFACSLLSDAVAREGEAHPKKAQRLLRELTQYIQLRYVGEPLLALEYLAGLGNECDPTSFQSNQFWSQIRWVAGEMDLTAQEIKNLEIPSE